MEEMTDEQLAKRIASDKAELERRSADRVEKEQRRHRELMAAALSTVSISGKRRGRKPVNAAD